LSWRWMLLTIGLQFLFVSYHCTRNLTLLLGSSTNQHSSEAHGRWWRTLGGLQACLRFFRKLGFCILKLHCCVVLC
jgi:arginine exporter protein ArgO